MVCRSLEVSRPQEQGDRFMEDRQSPNRRNAGNPHWHPGDSMLMYSQNVAGLWLKYGARSLNIEVSSPRAIPFDGVTICLRQALTTPIGRAYKPPTERGAVLALGQGGFSCP